jgi:diguanylate cyclase
MPASPSSAAEASAAHSAAHPASRPAGASAGGEGPAKLPPSWAVLLQRLAKGLEQGSKAWTLAQRKDSLQRLLSANRRDDALLAQRLAAMLNRWEGGQADLPAATLEADVAAAAASTASEAGGVGAQEQGEAAAKNPTAGTVPTAMPAGQATHAAALLRLLCEGLADLGEGDAWAQAQAQWVQSRLAEGVDERALRDAQRVLGEARARQQQLKAQREAAQAALQALVPQLIAELGGLDAQTGRYETALAGHAQAIAEADSLPALAERVQGLVQDTQTLRRSVGDARSRLEQERSQALALQAQVQVLQDRLDALSSEVATDALTGAANRRGLEQAFVAEAARAQREGVALAVALLDIDNFKKLNDGLGHAAGDEALKALAQRARDCLRPVDTVARYGGEEFVLLLPGSDVSSAQATLSRLQRALSAALFMHEGQGVMVTFSAGITQWRSGEPLAAALERADGAMYEAKRSGKNRSCIA